MKSGSPMSAVPARRDDAAMATSGRLGRWTGRIMLILVLTYVGLCLLAAGCTNRILFQPHPSSYADLPQGLKLTTADGVAISAVYLPNPQARFTILFSHGNAEDLGDCLPFLEHLRNLGFSVLAYDYHGYGTSGGEPSEEACCADINAAYAYLTGQLKVPAERIIIFGRSVGGGPSVDLASRQKAAGLVVQSTFTSVHRIVLRYPLLPGDPFKNIDKIGRVQCPVLVMHGRADQIIPFRHGEQLFAAAHEPKQCLWIDNAGHNDFLYMAGERFDKVMLAFAETLHDREPSVN